MQDRNVKDYNDFLEEESRVEMKPVKKDCPYCGRCPHCGRTYNYYPWYPYWTKWTDSTGSYKIRVSYNGV